MAPQPMRNMIGETFLQTEDLMAQDLLGYIFLPFLADLTTNKLENTSKSKLTRELLINLCHPTQNNKPVKALHTRAVQKNSSWDGVSWQIQQSAMPRAIFGTQPHTLRCIFHTALVAVF